MKKFLAVVMAVVMVMALAVSASAAVADDEVIFEFSIPAPIDTNGSWWDTSSGFSSNADFITALQTEGAMLRIECDPIAVDGEEGHGFQFGLQATSGSWGSALVHSNFAEGEGVFGADHFVVEGDRAYIYVDAPAYYAAIVAAFEAAGDSLDSWQWVSGQCSGKNYSVAVVKTASVAEPAPAETETAPAETETAPAETETAPVETETAPAPSTGIALAVIPAVVAMAAAVVSKKH